MSEIRRGAMLSYVTVLVVNISGLLLTPLVIRGLGSSEYGLYMLIGSLAAYLGVLDFGLNNAVTRYVAQSAANGDRSREARFLGAALVVNAVAIFVILALGTAFYFSLDSMFSRTFEPTQLKTARLLIVLLTANVVFTVSASLFSAICAGHERFTFNKSVNFLRYVFRIFLVIALLNAGGGAVALAALDLLLAMSVFAANGIYVFNRLDARFSVRPWDQAIVRGVFAFSSWVFLFAIIGQFQWQTGQVVLGAVKGPEAVAVYAVGIMLGTYYGAFSTAFSSLYMARATHMTESKASSEELTAEMSRIGRLSLLVLLLILGGFVCFGQAFVLLWAGPEYGASWSVALIIMLVYTLPLIQSFANQLLEAKGIFAYKAKIYLMALPVGMLLGYFLLPFIGVPGMALGIAVGWTLALVVMNVYYHRVLNLDILCFFRMVYSGIMPVFALCICWGFVLNTLPVNGWFALIIQIILFTLFYAFMMYRFGMSSYERGLVRHFTRRLPWTHA